MSEASTQGALESFAQRVRFGSFEILRDEAGSQRLLGKGAFGRTYQARHVFLEREVALKLINDKFLSDATARERFLSEARAAARLSHAHIAQILDFGETDGILFYAMEYCRGGDLGEYVKRHGAVSIVQTVQIGLQVASALQCAHQAGFIHRDLKPSNVMLAAPEGPLLTKLIDFGLVINAPAADAEPIDPDLIPTIEQRFIGTPLFASPEQLLVQPLDGRSDFFSLGMTLWFLLVGSAPDPGNSAAIVSSRLGPESYEPRLPRKLPRSFHTLLARLLEKKLEARFASADAVLAAFAACAAELGVPTAPLGAMPVAGITQKLDPEAEAAVEEIAVPLEECYTISGPGIESPTGTNFDAVTAGDATPVCLHVLKTSLAANPQLMAQVRKNVAKLQRAALFNVVLPGALRVHPDRTVIVLEKPPAKTLLTGRNGPARLTDARTLLQGIAAGCDGLRALELPVPELEAQRVFLEMSSEAGAEWSGAAPRLFPRFLTHRDAAALAPDEGQNDATATMAYDTLMDERIDAPGWQFATLIYRVISGRACPSAATLSPRGYVTIPALAEESNRILSLAIARELVHPTCTELLTDLLIAEGLLGASATRTQLHTTTSADVTDSPFDPGVTRTTSSTRPSPAAAPLPSPPSLPSFTADHLTHVAAASAARAPLPPSLPPAGARASSPKRQRSSPIFVSLALLLIPLALVAAAAIYLIDHFTGNEDAPTQAGPGGGGSLRVSTVRLTGDIPPHATARIDSKTSALRREGQGWSATLDGIQVALPAWLIIEAKGFAPLALPLREAADLEKPIEANLQRSQGTLVFADAAESDYDHATLKMTAQLPDEESYVELERFTRGFELKSGQSQTDLPTGIFQVVVKGANDRVTRPRVLGRVEIRPGETASLQLPPPIAGDYTGKVSVQQPAGSSPGRLYNLEFGIDPGLTTGWLLEHTTAGPHRIPLSEGYIDSEGAYHARIQYSAATDTGSRFDQMLTLSSGDGGALAFKAIESPEVNSAVEARLSRQPYPADAFAVEGAVSRVQK